MVRTIYRTVDLGTGEVYPHRLPPSSLRIGPVRDSKLIASLWRIWIQSNDVYAANRNTAKLSKASLHATGKWFFTVGNHRMDLAAPVLLPGGDWHHALEIAFLIPEDSIPVPDLEPVKSSKRALSAVTPLEHKLAVNILFGATEATAHETPIPGAVNGPILMRTRLTRGTPIVVVGRVLPFSDQDRAVIQAVRAGVTVTSNQPVRDPRLEIAKVSASPMHGNVISIVGMAAAAFRAGRP